uniref:Opa interacting protein 5 n=1 Tax=Anas platyrhynchos TaxID=8839 RepID=A0A8B9QS96_ANAPL
QGRLRCGAGGCVPRTAPCSSAAGAGRCWRTRCTCARRRSGGSGSSPASVSAGTGRDGQGRAGPGRAGQGRARCSRVSLLSSGVTGDVAWEDALLVGLEGALLGCAYNALYCRLCGSMVGFILYSAFSNLAHLRGLFCFFKESILCYLLKNNITIEASKVNFPALTLKEQLGKLKEKLVMVHMRLELLIKKTEELKQKNMAQNYGSASDAVALMPGYASSQDQK